MKNKVYIIAFIVTFALMSACSKSSDRARIAQLESQIAEMSEREDGKSTQSENKRTQQSEESGNSYVSSSRYTSIRDREDNAKRNAIGTYEVTDEIGNTWVIELKEDETATMHQKGDGYLVYGSWDPTNYLDYAPGLEFFDERPILFFPSGEESLFLPHIVDGYLYEDGSSAQAKNPRKRLSVKKVK